MFFYDFDAVFAHGSYMLLFSTEAHYIRDVFQATTDTLEYPIAAWAPVLCLAKAFVKCDTNSKWSCK